MKTSIVFAAISAGLVTAEMLPPPDNFPACGTTCFGNMLGQASQLGCGGGGSTENAVDGACLCSNIDFSYGIIDCANAACPQGAAQSVVQYGVNWCAEQGVVISGLSATPDPSVASSPSATVSAVGGTGDAGSSSGTASPTTSEIISTLTNSDGSVVTTAVGTTTLSDGSGDSSDTGGVVIPITTSEIVSTLTNSDGDVVTTTLATSTIFSTSGAGTESGSATDGGSDSESTPAATESGNNTSDSTGGPSATTTEPASSTDGTATTSSDSTGGCFQTAAPVGLAAAAGLAALML
ncbi:hypothetical protein F4802DRAFT_63664 [Xylaria palmicola]|nr:hypothetical protein F4802DRAFT_63664 [Xylaria palmicola]